jgi:hypothetical protein
MGVCSGKEVKNQEWIKLETAEIIGYHRIIAMKI